MSKRERHGQRSAAGTLRRIQPAALLAAIMMMVSGRVPVTAAEVVTTAARDAGGDAAEIIVTARHRKERPSDVPLAISVLRGAELGQQHLDRIADYASKISNFSASAANPRLASINIRGLGSNAGNDGAEGGVGLIVDDVFFTHVGFAWLDFVDLESIEVARGPQGTLLGKNTTIGAVIIRTLKPSFDPSATASISYASHDRIQLRAHATGTLVSDKLAYRLTFAGDRGGGWIHNRYNGKKLLDNRRGSVRGQLLFTPHNQLTSRLIVEHYRFHEYNNHVSPGGDILQNLYINDPSALHPDNSAYSPRTENWTQAVGRVDSAYVPQYGGPDNADVDTLGRMHQQVYGVSHHLEYQLSHATLTAVTAWRRMGYRPQNDQDLTPYPVFRLGYNVDVHQYSQEVRLASEKHHTIEWDLGFYYLHQDLRSDFNTRFYRDAARFFIDKSARYEILNGVDYGKRGDVTVDSGALFGQGTYHLTDQLLLTAGLRYTRERKALTTRGWYTVSGEGGADTGLGPVAKATRLGVLASFGGIFPAQYAASTGSYWSWLINPAYKLSNNALVYFAISGGSKSGAANTVANPTMFLNGKAIIRPEKAFDIEVGAKIRLIDDNVSLNINFYRSDIRGYQSSQVDPAVIFLGNILGNVGHVRMQGLELDAAFRPHRTISFGASAAYNKATYVAYENAQAPTEYQVYLATLQNVSPKNTTLSLTGYRVIGVPAWTANASVNLDLPIARGVNLTAYANQSYRTAVPLLNPRSQFGWQGPISLTNAGVGLTTNDGRWALNLWSKNLFNLHYLIGMGAAQSISSFQQFWGEARTFGMTLTTRM